MYVASAALRPTQQMDFFSSLTLIPEFLQRPRLLRPLLLHADKQFEEDLRAEEPFDVLPRRGADALQHGPALAYDDALLRVPLYVDGRGYGYYPFFLLEPVHNDRNGIGYLFLREDEDLLPHYLGD